MKNGSYVGRRSIRTGPVGAGTARPVREAAVVTPIRCAAPFPLLRCPDVSLRGAKRRGNLGKALPIRTGRRSIRTGPVGAGHAPPVREAAVVPPIRCAAPFPLLRRPDVSLRGAKRRGNLAVPGRITGKPSAKSQLPPRDCTPRALPRASRSGRHVGLRPPRNDKSGGGHPRFIDGPLITPVQRRERHAAPYRARAVGGHAPPLPIYHKMTARRGYRRAVVVYRSRKNSRVCSALCTMAARSSSRLSNFRSGRRKV